MKWIFGHKLELTLTLFIILLYFAIRIPNLTKQPIFADEGIYIRWAQVMRAEPTLRFLPLSDGKTPLYMWILMPVLKILDVVGIDDPLFAGRFLSVICGFFTMLGVYFLARQVFNLKVGLWSAFLYAVVPFTVFFNRMALVDSMMSAFTIWSLFFAIWLLKVRRLDVAMILGFLLAGGILTKTPAMLNILSLPATIIGFKFLRSKRVELLKLLMFWGVAFLIAAFLYNLLRLGPNFHLLSARDSDYVFPFHRIFTHPFDPFAAHVLQFIDWLTKFVGLATIFIVAGIFFICKNTHRLGLTVLVWTSIPMLILLTYLQTFTARYLLFIVAPLLVIAGFGIEKLLEKISVIQIIKIITVVLMVAIWPIYFNFLLLTKPELAPLPKDERRGYLEDWTAGYGFSEIAQFLVERKRNIDKVVVGTEGYFGTLPDGLQIYLDKSGIPIIGGQASVSAQIRNAAKDNETYFVGNKNRLPSGIENANLIKEYPKAIPLGDFPRDAIVVYQIFPK